MQARNKNFVPPRDSTTPVHTRRVPKRKVSSCSDTPESFFYQKSLKTESPATAPAISNISNSQTTSTHGIFNAISEVETKVIPNLEAAGSCDSFIIPLSVCEVLLGCPDTPVGSEHGGTASRPNESRTSACLQEIVQLVEKNREEHNEFLQNVEKIVQEIKLLSTPARPEGVVIPVPANNQDLMGTQTPLFIILKPENFFAVYNEFSFDTQFGVNIVELVRHVKWRHLATAEDCRFISFFLSVTSDEPFFNTMFRFVENNLKSRKYVVDWKDLKIILVNLGLTKEFYLFDGASYCGIDTPKAPKIWNFKFLFMIVEHSFPTWSKKRLLRLLKFLSDCLFDPILQQCQHDVVLLLRRVAKHMLKLGATLDELVAPLNHSHYSMICNRVIIQHLAPDRLLKPLARTMAYRTIHILLKLDNYGGNFESNMFSHIADLLADIHSVREKASAKDVCQLISICECLVAMASRPFDSKTTTFLEKLADFAEHMSLSYSYFENVYFNDVVTRLRESSTFCPVRNFSAS